MPELDQPVGRIPHHLPIVERHLVESSSPLGRSTSTAGVPGRVDQFERLAGIVGRNEQQAGDAMAQKLAHPAQLHLRIAPRQDLHDLIAADGGDVLEALDERREIGAVDMRHGDPHDRGALAALRMGEHVLLVAERAHRALDPLAQARR